MNKVWWLIKWVLKAAIFFTLFAFALNNQQDITVHFFFGNQWQAPQVLVVLTAFAVGVAVGVAGMVPWWWKQRQKAKTVQAAPVAPDLASGASQISPPIQGPAYADGI